MPDSQTAFRCSLSCSLSPKSSVSGLVIGTSLWLSLGSCKGSPQTPAKGDTPASGSCVQVDEGSEHPYISLTSSWNSRLENQWAFYMSLVVLEKPLEAFLGSPSPGASREPCILTGTCPWLSLCLSAGWPWTSCFYEFCFLVSYMRAWGRGEGGIYGSLFTTHPTSQGSCPSPENSATPRFPVSVDGTAT